MNSIGILIITGLVLLHIGMKYIYFSNQKFLGFCLTLLGGTIWAWGLGIFLLRVIQTGRY